MVAYVCRKLNRYSMPPPTAFLFNGDADGIIAQHLLYLSGIRPGLRITGMKRDLALLRRLPESFHGEVHVLDIGFKANAKDAEAFLARRAGNLTWYDHHESGPLIVAPEFKAHIHPTRGQCTGLIVNAVLGHRYDLWAATAAFGDNQVASAQAILARHALSEADTSALRQMGEALNYNAYGEVGDALHTPLSVAQKLEAYDHPLICFRESGLFEGLAGQLAQDEAQASALMPWRLQGNAQVYLVPDAPWARRYGATWMNRLVQKHSDQAFAIFQERSDGTYLASLRAPQSGPYATWSAASFAEKYPSGGGRVQAAGINALPAQSLNDCAEAFLRSFA